MIRFIALIVALIAVSPAAAFAASCPINDNEIKDPAPLVWTHVPGGSGVDEHWTASLEIGIETLCVGGETITTRVYRVPGTVGTIPGPTIVMEPGKKYVLQFKNVLPYDAPDPEHNILKDPNISNLHTHGLHISGESPGDDVTRSFEGGAGGDFVYDIPADHMGGTYWYHAHHHGSTFLQVSAGAFGLLLIDDQGDRDDQGNPIPQNVRDMDERHLVIGYLDPSVSGTGGDTLISGTLSPTWTVNGMVAGELNVPENKWQHWRVLLADRDAKSKTVSVGANCEVALLARDGVWRNTVPKVLADNSIELTGASRADLAVRCSGDSEITVGNDTVGQIFVDGTLTGQGHPFAADGESNQTTWKSGRPWYLRNMRPASPDNFETINMGARSVMGSKFDKDIPNLELYADGLQEWKLKGATNHPFHLHIYHVQVIGDCGEYEDGEFYDVVAGNCTIRFDLDASVPESTVYAGRTIMHCHILEHEDQGAMAWLDVLGLGDDYLIPPPTFPSSAYQEYYPPDIGGVPPAAPSSLVATAVSSSQIDLNWTDNSNDEDGFDIERTEGGMNQIFVNVATDVTSYMDTDLTAGTSYTYRVRSYSNTNGNSNYSDTATATTLSGSDPTTLVLDSITVTTYKIKGDKFGRAEVVVGDDIGGLVAGATVFGEFIGGNGSMDEVGLSGVTDVTGLAVIDGSQPYSGKGNPSLTFCVTGVTHDTLEDLDLSTNPVCGSR
jgi:FtsP/CotA-like multicopper oxidase with cupredoxin domain